jgi:ABC-type glycerol-3-phosphate transport system substrate-binding protein
MKKWIALLICMIAMISVACAEENVLRIAITTEEDAINWPTEEAFFLECPDMEIEYILYSEEQLNARIQAGTTGADLVILPYQDLAVLEEKGYLTYLDDAAGLTEYPKQIIDLSSLLEKNGRLFALPVSIGQDFWYWNEKTGSQMGLTWPGTEGWTWADFEELSSLFPKDSNGDGNMDVFLMSGSSIPAYPALSNINISPFLEYISTHTSFDQFTDDRLALFKRLVSSSGLLDMRQGQKCSTLLGTTGETPFIFLEKGANLWVGGETLRMLFLPPPTWEGESSGYPGWLRACAVLKNSSSPSLAADFIHAMLSEKAMTYVPLTDETKWVGKSVPLYAYVDQYDQYTPEFVAEGDVMKFTVRPGRNLLVALFGVSGDSYLTGQAFRSKLRVDTKVLNRDFYDAAWAALQEWLYGNMNDEGLRSRMNYLFNIAAGQ